MLKSISQKKRHDQAAGGMAGEVYGRTGYKIKSK
jgi:hypothetical protein